MKLYGKSEEYILAECLNCGKVLKIELSRCKPITNGYALNPPVKCFCGIVEDNIIGNNDFENEKKIKCPKCGSTQISSNKKGFSLGKAAGGAILTGGIGILAGLIGKNKIYITCLKCGNKWQPS